jgi:large conductance mechanosensitive channel
MIGSFITAVINFVIIAFVVFLLVKAVNRIKASTTEEEAKEEAPPGPSELDVLVEIRDALAKK